VVNAFLSCIEINDLIASMNYGNLNIVVESLDALDYLYRNEYKTIIYINNFLYSGRPKEFDELIKHK